MEQYDLLRRLVLALEKLGINYYITGSMTTIFFGEYRTTNDIDVVVELSPKQVAALEEEFPSPEFYFNEPAAQMAARSSGQFNIIQVPTGLKIDVMVPRDTAFDGSCFSRIVRVQPGPDYSANFSSMEDIILKKMEFYREGGSDKHLRDIGGILKINGDKIDMKYIAGWALRLGVETIWREILEKVGRLDAYPFDKA